MLAYFLIFLGPSVAIGTNIDFDYTKSEIGKRSIETLRQAEKRSYVLPILSMSAGGLGECGVAGMVYWLSTTAPGLSIMATFLGTGACGAAIVLGAICLRKQCQWNAQVQSYYELASILEQAYIAMSDDERKAVALENIESFLVQADPNWRITYVLRKNLAQELAERFVLANEAGLFSCKSEIFPDTENPDLGIYANSADAPVFQFNYKDQDLPNLEHLDRLPLSLDKGLTDASEFILSIPGGGTRLIPVPDLLKMDREKLISQAKSLRVVQNNYKKYLAQKPEIAKEFLGKIEIKLPKNSSELTTVQVCPEQ